ncbi:hypothetical protein ACFO5O_05640 [Geojedonia litorea]|uniref:Uncharacterized protein n=1 Tax=Geojedonia litorea TaxID=1268269 RepID=A0ABV9N0I1_9FLAO
MNENIPKKRSVLVRFITADPYLIGDFFNYIGGTMRWLFGKITRIFKNKPKFEFKEYINGPKNPDYYDQMGHGLNNILIGILTFLTLIIPLIKIIFD